MRSVVGNDVEYEQRRFLALVYDPMFGVDVLNNGLARLDDVALTVPERPAASELEVPERGMLRPT